MSIEALLWGWLPAALAVATVFASAFMAVKARRAFHSVFSVIVVLLGALALWMLFAIFVMGGWPTFLPHIFVGITVMLVLIQMIVFRKMRSP